MCAKRSTRIATPYGCASIRIRVELVDAIGDVITGGVDDEDRFFPVE